MKRVYISQCQIERLFHNQVGFSPKKYARLMRVASARDTLKTPDIKNTAEVAYSAGFFDQAHLIRDFKTVVGLSPGEYLKREERRRDRLNSYSEVVP